MNKISQNGVKITQTKDSIIYNGVEYKLPDNVKSTHNRISMINGKIKVNGYLFDPVTGTFTKSYSTLVFIILVIAYIIYKFINF